MTRKESDTNQTESSVEYHLSKDAAELNQDIAVHREIGESEFDYVLTGSNPDAGSDLVLFGFHENELPGLPLPEDDD